jgi:hypothetical protein
MKAAKGRALPGPRSVDEVAALEAVVPASQVARCALSAGRRGRAREHGGLIKCDNAHGAGSGCRTFPPPGYSDRYTHNR